MIFSHVWILHCLFMNTFRDNANKFISEIYGCGNEQSSTLNYVDLSCTLNQITTWADFKPRGVKVELSEIKAQRLLHPPLPKYERNPYADRWWYRPFPVLWYPHLISCCAIRIVFEIGKLSALEHAAKYWLWKKEAALFLCALLFSYRKLNSLPLIPQAPDSICSSEEVQSFRRLCKVCIMSFSHLPAERLASKDNTPPE